MTLAKPSESSANALPTVVITERRPSPVPPYVGNVPPRAMMPANGWNGAYVPPNGFTPFYPPNVMIPGMVGPPQAAENAFPARAPPQDSKSKDKSVVVKKATPAKKKKRTKKQKGEPKRPRSAYHFFFQEEYPKVRKSLFETKANDENGGSPNLFDSSVMKIVVQRWKELDSLRLLQYKAKAKVDEIRFKKEMNEFLEKKASSEENVPPPTDSTMEPIFPSPVAVGFFPPNQPNHPAAAFSPYAGTRPISKYWLEERARSFVPISAPSMMGGTMNDAPVGAPPVKDSTTEQSASDGNLDPVSSDDKVDVASSFEITFGVM